MSLFVVVLLLLTVVLSKTIAQDESIVHSSSDRQLIAATYTKCGFSSSEHYATWYQDQFTNSPVLFPQDDTQLADIVTTARDSGCKVRVRGSGQSEDGLVMQKLDELNHEVVIVNLKDYRPTDADWDQVINNGTTPSVKISAGASTLELMRVIRPQGYVLTTNTAGRLFSVGGSYLNPSVHGNVVGESRLAAQVLSVRVMNADGDITVYSGNDDAVKDFRGSMGLLGIVTALEIQIKKDTGLFMTRDTLQTDFDDTLAVQTWLQQKLTVHDGTQFFYFVQDDAMDAYSLDFSGNPSYDYASTEGYYVDRVAQFPDLSYTGSRLSFGELLDFFAPVVTVTQLIAMSFGQIARAQTQDTFDQSANMPNDAHFIPEDMVANVEILQYSILCATDCADEMVNVLQETRTYLKAVQDDPLSTWYPTMPLEWRVFDVQPNEMVLEHLEPGRYLAVELACLSDGDNTYARFFGELEDKWRTMYPKGGIHHGKGWGWGPVAGMGEFPFQNNAILDTIYSDAVRDIFIAKMNFYDPSQTFRAGSVLRMLGLTTKEYTPKQYDGGSCQTYKDSECISNCCGWVPFGPDQCRPTNKPKGDYCDSDCECRVNTSGNPCRWLVFSWVNKCRD